MSTTRVFFCVFLIWIFEGCEHESLTDLASDDNFNISISVEKDVYTFNAGPEPKVTLRNDSKREVYFPMSSYVGFERFQNGNWINYTEWFVVDGIGYSWPLKSGQSITEVAPFGYFSQEEIPGTYRFKFLVYKDKNLKFPLPLNQRVSRPFEVVK
ncbi:hypothetical protein L0337_29695 [candidate division KSB1 bacterium]|nr:hypothetical protein [candidate division KSB1 bacterium]